MPRVRWRVGVLDLYSRKQLANGSGVWSACSLQAPVFSVVLSEWYLLPATAGGGLPAPECSQPALLPAGLVVSSWSSYLLRCPSELWLTLGL